MIERSAAARMSSISLRLEGNMAVKKKAKRKQMAQRLEEAVQQTLRDQPDLVGMEAEVEFELARLLKEDESDG
jgi:hypothetical protein